MNKQGNDQLEAVALTGVAIAVRALMQEDTKAEGRYVAHCMEVIPERKAEYDVVFQRFLAAVQQVEGRSMYVKGWRKVRELEEELHAFPMQEVWAEPIDNVVCTVGKNLMLDTALAGSSYTVTGPYMLLISSVSWSAVSAADTMASHAGWTEAGSTNAPTFTARGSMAWSSAASGSKSTSTGTSFTMTSAGTLKGCAIVFGTGAVTTLMSTAGTILSAGAFTGGDQTVSIGNVVTVTYSLGL